MQVTDPPAMRNCCTKKAELFMSSAFEHSVFLLKLYYVSSLHSASAFR